MQHGLAAADVVRDVFDVGGAADAGGDVEAGDLDADAVPGLELVRGRHDLDGVFVDLAGYDRLARRARERMPRPAGQRPRRIDGAMGRLEPAARELAFVQAGCDIALAFAGGLHADVGPHVLEDDDPVGVVLVDRREEVEHARPRDGDVFGQRLAQIAQLLDPVGLARRHLRERVRRLVVVGARRQRTARWSDAPSPADRT